MRKVPILFVHLGDDWIRGSEQVLIDLLSGLERRFVWPVVWCNSEAMATACENIGVKTYKSDFEFYFDYRGSPQPRFSFQKFLGQITEGIQLVRRHKVRLIHANGIAPCQWMVPVARFTKLPILAHLHALHLRRTRFISLAHLSSMIVGCSNAVTREFESDGIPSEAIKTIYNGIDLKRLKPHTKTNLRRALGISPQSVIISSIGSLEPHKGHDVLIRALGLVTASAESHLIIVGDGLLRENLEQLGKELELESRIHFYPHCQDVGTIYAGSDIFALPSRIESFGLVLAEAGWFGLPSVATNVGGVPEVIENDVSGVVVTPEDPMAFARALSRLIEDVECRRRLGLAAQRRVQALFTQDQMILGFQQTYETLIELPKPKLGIMAARHKLTPYMRQIGMA